MAEAMYEVPGSRLRELSDRIAELTAALDQLYGMIQFRLEAVTAERGTYAWDPDGVRHKYVSAQQTYCDGQIAAYEELAAQVAKLKSACS